MKTIKSIIAIAALLVGAGTARAALDFPSVPTYSPGKNASLSVVANTPDGTSAIQFTLNLPDAFSIYDTTLEIDKTMAPDHLCRVNKVSDSSYRCVIYSNSNTPFASDTGKLFSINLKADPTAPKGDYTLSFTEIRSSDASGEETTMPDASVSLVVIIPAKSVSISPSPTDISVGETAKLTASVLPAEASQIVRWSTSDPATATVSDDGTVTGIAPGNAVITATTADGTNLSAQCSVNVKPVLVTSITVTPSGLVLHPGETGTLTAAVLPANAGNRSVEWTSGNPSVVTVNADGLVEAKAVGTAVITATATDGSGVSAECTVSVTVRLAESISISRDRLDLTVDRSETLKAVITPADASQIVRWSTSDPATATVSDDGTVTGIAPGNAVITATTADGTNLSAQCNVNVKPVLVTSITVAPSSLVLHPGETGTLTAAVLPENAGNRSVEWTSGNPSVVTVSADGLVEAKAVGTAVITATATDGSGVSAECTVSVTVRLAESISISRDRLDLTVDRSETLKAVITPADASQIVRWSTSDPATATVSDDGTVTGIAPGTAVITATTADGTNLSAQCSLNVKPVLVSSITVTPSSLVLHPGETGTLTAAVLPANAGNRSVEWTSGNPSVATVNAYGLVEAKAVGTAVITATATDGSGVSAECTVSVTVRLAESISISRDRLDLTVDRSETLKAVIAPADASQIVRWSSSDPATATVSDDGTVTGIAPGTAVITATTTDGTNLSAQCNVNVRPVLVTSITVTPSSLVLHPGETGTLTAAVLPANAGNRSVEWTSGNPSVATVNADGLVEAKAVGTAVITATATDGSGVSAECTVSVTVRLAESISISRDRLDLTVDRSETLKAVITPADASQIVRWSTSDPATAIVSDDGTVTGIAPGTAVITATTADGTNLSAQCSVNVRPVLVSSITVTPSNLVLHPGETGTLTAAVLPANAGNRSVEWTSGNPSVVTVNADGLVEAKAVGTAVITATATDGSGVSAECTVSVTVRLAESISISRDRLDLTVDRSETLKAVIAPADASQIVRWSSSDPATAIVSDDGTVTGIAPGNAVITATTADGTNLSAQCSVNVRPVLVSSITVTPSNLVLHPGETGTLTAAVLPANAGNRSVEWTSGNPSVVTVNADGLVEAKAVGTAVITATATDGSGVSAECAVSVTAPLAESIVLDHDRLDMKVGECVTVKASVTPAGALQEVEWICDDTEIISVDNDGLVTALSPGYTVITASVKDDSGLQAYCEVYVEEESGIDGVETESIPVINTLTSEIVVTGIPDDEIIRIITPSGSMVYCGTGHRISGLAQELYIVIVRAHAYKVYVR